MTATPEELDRVYRAEFGQAVATLAGVFGDVSVAEDAVQEAFAIAIERWSTTGLPPNPGGWITTTARRRAIDRLRREARRDDRHAEAALLHEQTTTHEPGYLGDDRLKLLFTCCHPALAAETRVALTLRLVAGLRTSEIARAFLVSESAMEQRLVRARRKIRATGLPYRVPDAHELPDRLAGVLAVTYLVFTEGHTASTGDPPIRAELVDEAIRLARLLDVMMPDEPEVRGLLALLLATDARRAARTSDDGSYVPLAEQDRSAWDRGRIEEARDLLRSCVRRGRPGPYQIQAAISAVHNDAPTHETTDWRSILDLYDRLLTIAPSPVTALNRAVVLAEIEGPASALAAIEALDLERYQPYHAARADLLRRLGRHRDAARAYDRACELTANEAHRRFLGTRRRASSDAS